MDAKVYGCLLMYAMGLQQCSELLGTDKVHFSKRLQDSNDCSTSVYTFEWMVQISKTDCVKTCKSTKACEYINYEVRSHACALIRRNDVINNSIAVVVEKKPGYIFGNKSEWNMDAFTECDKCSTYGKCTSGNTECRNSGCGMPSSNGFHGNVFSNGSSILKTHPVVFQHKVLIPSICGEYGDWIDQYNFLPYWNGSYYYIQTQQMSWADSMIDCETMSGHLIDIGSEEEENFLKGLAHENVWMWIGGNDMEDEGTFVWSDGSVVSDGYTNWWTGNPDNWYEEDCMMIRLTDYMWNDLDCDSLQGSVCEI